MPRNELVLAVVAADRTFERRTWRGREIWWGKCIHCNTRVAVGADGALLEKATIEHIRPRSHGGTDDVDNLSIACKRCNNQKGCRLDNRPAGDPRLEQVIEATLERKARRAR